MRNAKFIPLKVNGSISKVFGPEHEITSWFGKVDWDGKMFGEVSKALAGYRRRETSHDFSTEMSSLCPETSPRDCLELRLRRIVATYERNYNYG